MGGGNSKDKRHATFEPHDAKLKIASPARDIEPLQKLGNLPFPPRSLRENHGDSEPTQGGLQVAQNNDK